MLAALGLPGSFDAELHASAARMLPPDGRKDALLAVLFRAPGGEGPPSPQAAEALMERFEFPAETRAVVEAGAFGVDRLAERIEPQTAPSRLRELLALPPARGAGHRRRPGRAPLAGAGEAVARWLGELRHVRLQIDGGDLLAAGVKQGPELGRRLERVLDLRLDGVLEPGRDAELRGGAARPAPWRRASR